MTLNGGIIGGAGDAASSAASDSGDSSQYVDGYRDASGSKTPYLERYAEQYGHPDERDLSVEEIQELPVEARTAGEKMAVSFAETGSTAVGGETVTDNETGVSVEGPADTTQEGGVTSIDEADREDLEASGIDDSGATNTSEDVDEFVQSRNQNQSGGSGSSSMGGNSSGEGAGVGALADWLESSIGVGSIDTDQIVTAVAVALVLGWLGLSGGSDDG